ncbi:MAG: gliding motility-associated C-terminal domain-containing protein [Chitinophagaceae bacterium]|nr:gliding motility-associated C-terminal domain-containing protein [Chitinophagaceae bacterium]
MIIMLLKRYIPLLLIACTFSCALSISVLAQCPPNIDFENGDFSNWTCYTGNVASVNDVNVINFNYSGGPTPGRQTMYSAFGGGGLDPYGGFPVNCPNGSGHSIRLGNNSAGREAEGISYDFTIPAGANTYNLIYNYAVVFQDPGHQESEQPRLDLLVQNLSDGYPINCSSFSFFANGSPLPGFQLSPNPGGNTPVWYKSWTAVSINLDNLAGKRIRLFFKTADCTFRIHFGYAYIDVNSECSDRFEGADFCPDDNFVRVNAPYGYQTYTWYNPTFTQVLGNSQTLTLTPPPTAGTQVAVVVVPYSGYGCLDTLYTTLYDTLNYKANAGPDKVSCNNSVVQIGVPPKPGWNYLWTPPVALSSDLIANPFATPDVTTDYILHVNHIGGGCRSTDTVTVQAAKLYDDLDVFGKPNWCIGSGDSSVLQVKPCDSVQWYKNGIAIPGANQQRFKATETGTYSAQVFSFLGCNLYTKSINIDISSIPVPGFKVDKPVQCFVNNKFVFTNTSTNAVGGPMQYRWLTGDGFVGFTRDLTYSYKKPGTYEVVMIVNSSSACADSTSMTVTIHPNVFAEFSVNAACINEPVIPVNNTVDPGTSSIKYLWDFGNGQTSTLRNPPVQAYATPGNYVMSLTVSTAQCPFPLSIQKRFVRVEKPVAGKNNPEAYAVANLPLTLQARNIGNSALWTPAISLDNAASYTPVFIDNIERTYTIALKTAAGCITIDTQVVKINKNIVIYVPNAFTPNNDSRNDLLKPFMIGIKELVYFKIFNRWGELVFETKNITEGWDGRYKGNPVQSHTLVWMLQGIGADNKVYNAKGSTVLIR